MLRIYISPFCPVCKSEFLIKSGKTATLFAELGAVYAPSAGDSGE